MRDEAVWVGHVGWRVCDDVMLRSGGSRKANFSQTCFQNSRQKETFPPGDIMVLSAPWLVTSGGYDFTLSGKM